jgi:hypothetical protein
MTRNPDAPWTNRAAKAILLIRILVGWVFLSEGIQKFLFPDALGVGRFVKIGIPWPQVMAPFVGMVEIVCGSLLLIGLITRLAAIPLHRHLHRPLFHQDRHVCEEWILGHAARSPHGCQHAARPDFSTAGWRRSLVPRCKTLCKTGPLVHMRKNIRQGTECCLCSWPYWLPTLNLARASAIIVAMSNFSIKVPCASILLFVQRGRLEKFRTVLQA